MRTARLEILFAMMIAASSVGARGIACGPCGGTYVDEIVVLPPSDGNDADGGTCAGHDGGDYLFTDGGTCGGTGGTSTGTGGNTATFDAGDYLAEACQRLCAGGESCEPTMITTASGTVPGIACTRRQDCSAGRRPRGLEAHTAARGGATAAWLAEMAFLEAASVDAFKLLRRDLIAHGAPRRLVGAATRAARDERRHARRMTALARRAGGAPEAPSVRETPLPSLEELATQNAIEGCVRETYGALVARWQAGAAADREIGAALGRIAHEEARHATLSWQIDAWARRRLSRAARERVDRARSEAARALLASASQPVDRDLVHTAGHPDRATAERLARSMFEALGV